MAPEPGLTTAYLSYVVLSNYPIIACQVLIFFESVRVVPGEVRMYVRMFKRGKINIAEILFLLTKYLSLLSIISDALTELTSGWLTVTGCKALSWIYQMLLFFCTTLISTTLAWRCYVIFQRRQRVGIWLLTGLCGQLTAAMVTGQFQIKMKTIVDGYCSYLDSDIESTNMKPWYKKYGIWFLLYSFLFDSTLVICTSWRLIKCVKGPSGLQRIGKLLFVNNLHYIAIVGGLNLLEFFIFVFFSRKLPTLLPLTIVIEVMIGMNLIIAEQDAAHGYGRSTTTGYSGMPSNYSGPRPSSAGNSNWTDSKGQISTRGSTSKATGVEGIRFDCNEEILVDYDVTLTQMSPGVVDSWSPACPNGPEVDRFDRFVPTGDSSFGDKPRSFTSTTLRAHQSPQAIYGSSPSSISKSGLGHGLYHSPSNEQLRPQGNVAMHNQMQPPDISGGLTASGGVSIRAIRAQMNQHDNNQSNSTNPSSTQTGGNINVMNWSGESGVQDAQGYSVESYDTRALNRRNYHQQTFSPSQFEGGNMKRSDSMGSFASQCTCQESMYSAIVGPQPQVSRSNPGHEAQSIYERNHHQQHGVVVGGGGGQSDLEEIAQYDPDAPFADYRPQHIGTGRSGGSCNAY